ncbi:winged helix DNA-binding domain-containing protein [Streptomyces boninensis]|uniref:winged helix DNA-binding domain-containing protein n=1 Tax=Streptomyces boninensis TaxID=2039455 RepID=UPI003B228DC8
MIAAAQRRARLAHRQLLTPAARAARTEDVAEALVGLHATEAATVMLSARARLREPTPADVDRALYEDRTLVRMHAMRRTLWAVPADLVPVFHHSTTRTVARRERATLLKHLAATGTARDAAWLAAAEEAALSAVREAGAGGAGTAEVIERVPVLQETIVTSPGKPYEAKLRVGGSVLRVLAMDGRIRRARPLGGWAAGQFRYEIAPPMADLDPAEAQAEVARRWLRTYGPASTDDLKWWTGWSLGDTRRALARIEAVEGAVEGADGWLLAEDAALLADGAAAAAEPDPGPWAAFLPSLDPATMGWKHRDFYLDPALKPLLFDTAGNAGPTVWWRGEIIGAWAQRRDGEVVWRLLADRGAEARAAVEAEGARLNAWLAEHALVARFAAPLTAELVGDA